MKFKNILFIISTLIKYVVTAQNNLPHFSPSLDTTLNTENNIKPNANIDISSSEFEILKNNHPAQKLKHSVHHYKKHHQFSNKKDIYTAHCAINLCEALLESGLIFEYNNFKKCSRFCECETEKAGDHILLASDLMEVIKKKYNSTMVELTGENYLDYVKGKKGIIYFEDYWSRSKAEWKRGKHSGDHIDLWDNNKLISYGWLGTFIRNHCTNYTFENGGSGPSPLQKAKKVYFFELK